MCKFFIEFSLTFAHFSAHRLCFVYTLFQLKYSNNQLFLQGGKTVFFLCCLEAAEKFSLFLEHFQNCPYSRSLTKHGKKFRIVFYFFLFLCRSSKTENFVLDDDNVELKAAGRGWVGNKNMIERRKMGKFESIWNFIISSIVKRLLLLFSRRFDKTLCSTVPFFRTGYEIKLTAF